MRMTDVGLTRKVYCEMPTEKRMDKSDPANDEQPC